MSGLMRSDNQIHQEVHYFILIDLLAMIIVGVKLMFLKLRNFQNVETICRLLLKYQK